jgi:monovalent cation/hydrogen antiporter
VQSFELVLLLIAICVALGVVAKRFRLPYPILLVIGGLLFSIQPWTPQTPPLDPNLVFLFFLPPLLYAAAFNTRWRAFRSNLRAISLLAIGLVLFTSTLIAVLAHEYLDLPWAVGFVLGAIISPPDAVAAQAIMKHASVPPVISTILEGESLVNDASALVAYRMGVAVAVGGVFSIVDATTTFLIVSIGGIVLGLVFALLVIRLHSWLDRRQLMDSKLTITMTLLTPYAIYFPAEHLHLSGVLAVVTAGLWVGHRASQVFEQELYHEARAVWEMLEFLMNSLIFILIGLQLPTITQRLDDGIYSIGQLTIYAIVVSLTVIVARILWTFPGAYVPRWLDRKLCGVATPYPPWQYVMVVAWTGMRGVVSLAAAMALPLKTTSGELFPGRDLILFLTFWVIFATLVGQGLTLPLLIRVLRIPQLMAADAERTHSPEPNCAR